MKNLTKMLVILGVLLVGIGGILSQASATTLKLGENVMYFDSFENFYRPDSTDPTKGIYQVPGPANPVVVGDHFFGIINAQNIDAGGSTHWYSGAQDQITGIFAQRVEQIFDAPVDYFDPLQTNLSHLVLGPPTINQFIYTPDSTVADITGLLTGDEMIAFWRDTGAGATPFEYNCTMFDDFTKATDGSLWLTMGYADPNGDGRGGHTAGGVTNAADDTGYWYSHGPQGVPLQNFKGETYAALDSIQNFTGFPLEKTLNDPTESELGGPYPLNNPLSGNPIKLNEIYFTAELEFNPNSPVLGGTGCYDFLNNDPLHIKPVPDPGTRLLLGTGLVGLSGFVRKKFRGLS